jgi:hypothetical protein
LDARHFRRTERVATRFDSWNAAGHCAKEDRFEGGNLQKFSLASGKGTQEQPFLPSNTTEELGQLTSRPGIPNEVFAHPSPHCQLVSKHSIPARCLFGVE